MDPRLYAASESGDVKALKKFLPHVLHGVTPAGNNALHIAAYHGHPEFVRTLLRLWEENPEAGIDWVRQTNNEGNTVLHEAAKGGNDEVVEYLLEKCADLAFQVNGDGESAIFKAAEEGHMKPLERLLEATPLENYKRFDGQTPLHRAVATLHKGVTRKLLDERPELVNQSDIHDRTPLHIVGLHLGRTLFGFNRCSIIGGQIAKRLIERQMRFKRDIPLGYRVDENKQWGDIPLCYRVDENKQSALHIAVREGNVYVVKEILNYSKDCIEILDKDGKNALHLAVENAVQIYDRVGRGLECIISSLILRRLINCADNSGKTALDIAREQSEKDPPLFLSIIKYLERQGATSYILKDKKVDFSPTTPYNSNMLSVSASIMATVAFAAAITLPGIWMQRAHLPLP